MADGRKVGGVTYREAGADYFEQRKLRRHAGVWSLWALGVGAVISGDFYGWNFGLDVGGFGGVAGIAADAMVRLQGRQNRLVGGAGGHGHAPGRGPRLTGPGPAARLRAMTNRTALHRHVHHHHGPTGREGGV